LGIPYCSLFVFSTENWRRPKAEVEFLLNLVLEWAKEDKQELIDRGVRILPVGRWKDLPGPVVSAISGAAKATERGRNLTLLACINYGGRQEILDAVKAAAKAFAGDPRGRENLDEEKFAQFLYAPGVPEPDLIIRTSGEERLSNFLLWQSAYSEFVFTDVLWPDFGPEDIYRAVVSYGGRKRRFGDIADKEE
jgi:undecaprenyl diphosphate synthase